MPQLFSINSVEIRSWS